MLQVVHDQDLPFTYGKRNVALTFKERLSGIGSRLKRYVYRIKIPQWIVMNTERSRLAEQKEVLNLDDLDLSSVIADLNKKLVLATDEIIEREKPRVQYPWEIAILGIYLNKSLPLRIMYRKVVRHLPGSKKRNINDINANLANVKDYELIDAIIEIGHRKGFLKTGFIKSNPLFVSSKIHTPDRALEKAQVNTIISTTVWR